MVTLILGRAGTGKTALVMDRIRKLGEKGTQSILIVPEQYSHDAERQLCENCGDGVSLYAEVLSFSRLSNRVFAETGGLARKTLDAGGRVLVMNAALTALASGLKAYHPGRRRAELIRGLLHTYDELKTSGAAPEDLRAAGEKVDGAFGDKLSDLADIFGAYEALIPDGTADPGDRLADLANKIEKAAQLMGKHIFLDGFTDFTGQEAEIVDRLIGRGNDATVCLNCDGLNGDEPAFALPRRTAAHLLRTAAETGAKTEILNRTPTDGKKRSELRFAEQVLLTHDAETFEGECQSIRLFRETSKSRECELAAAEAVRLVRETGCRWRDIGVAARGFEDYEILAESIFEQYGVPVMMTRKEDILQKPVMALISAALDAVTGGWEYAPLFRYLKTGLTGISREETDLLENYVLKWNLRGSRVWAGEWAMNPEGYNREMTDAGRRSFR